MLKKILNCLLLLSLVGISFSVTRCGQGTDQDLGINDDSGNNGQQPPPGGDTDQDPLPTPEPTPPPHHHDHGQVQAARPPDYQSASDRPVPEVNHNQFQDLQDL